MDLELKAALARAREWEAKATPEQLHAMRKAQRESWMRGFAPCEHGDYDWETCAQCLKQFAERATLPDALADAGHGAVGEGKGETR